MYSDALFTKSSGGSQIAYAVQHFENLQGYRYTPLWTALFLVSVFSEIWPIFRVHFGGICVGILLVFCTAWLPWIKRWYRLRYGTVLTTRKSDKWWWYPITAYAIFSIAVPAFYRLEPYRDTLPLLWPMFLFVLPSGFDLPPADRAVRFRFSLYMLVMLSLLVAISCWPVLALSVQAVQAGTCAALLAMSLYDHWLLNHLLRPAHGAFV